MTVFMFALLGFPIFGGVGFFAKWYVLKAALQAPEPQTMLAVVLVLTTVISAGYYLYVVMVMFMRPRAADVAATARDAGVDAVRHGRLRRRDPRHRRDAADVAVRFANVGPAERSSAPTAAVDPALLHPANLSHAR